MTGREKSKNRGNIEGKRRVADDLENSTEKRGIEIEGHESRSETIDMQDDVIGCIQSSCGRFFIRNVESSFDFTEEDSLDEPNHDRDILLERELMKSIRNYSNPPKPKF